MQQRRFCNIQQQQKLYHLMIYAMQLAVELLSFWLVTYMF